MKNIRNIKFALAVAAVAVSAAAAAPFASANEAYKASNGEVFFKNSTLELGLNGAAVFGVVSDEIPAGFHPYYPDDWAGGGNTNALGIVAVGDPANPDWTDTRGDFTTNWDRLYLGVDGSYWSNTHWNGENGGGIPGSWDTPDAATGQLNWHQDGDRGGVHLDVNVKPVPGTTIVNTTYRLTNVTSNDVSNVAIAVGDNSFPCADSTFGQLDVNGQQGGKNLVTAVTKSRGTDCPNGKTQSITLASPDVGSKAVVHTCFVSFGSNWSSDPFELLNRSHSCFSRDFHGSTDHGFNIAVPANPYNGNTIAAGQSVELHVARCMNANEASLCGIKGLESSVHYPLTQVAPRAGGTLGGAGTVTFTVHGNPTHKYEISDDKYFRKGWKTAVDGDTLSWKVASSQLRKGKVGVTPIYIRDAADRFNSRSSVNMYWDSSPPYIKTATVHKRFVGMMPDPGKFDIALTIQDVSNPAALNMDVLDFATRLQFATGADMPTGVAFPAGADPMVVDTPPGAVAKVVLASDTVPRWVRAMDNFGNVGVWRPMVSLPKYPKK